MIGPAIIGECAGVFYFGRIDEERPFSNRSERDQRMKRQTIFLALLFPLLSIAQENQTIRAFKAEKLYVRGLELYQSGNVRGAIETFDQVIALDRNHGQVYQAKGDAFYELGDFDEAIESYTIAAQQYPDNANIRNSLGVAAGQMGMYRAAESYFLEALQIDPTLASASRNLERAQLKIREGSTAADLGYSWDDDPIRSSGSSFPSTSTGTSPSSGWGEPWPGNNSTSTTSADPFNRPTSTPSSTTGSTVGSGWGDGFTNRPTSTNPTTSTPITPTNTEPALPWERPARDPRKTTFSRDRGEINVTYRTDPFVHVDQVKITATSTLVILNVQSVSRDPFLISLEGPGSPGALMITDRQFNRAYRLKNVRLDGWPQEPYELRPGENKPIIVEFERIPDDLYFFHIVEGETPGEGSWDFYDVELVPGR